MKIDFKVTDAIINGTGVGQPLGIMNAPCHKDVVAAFPHTEQWNQAVAVVDGKRYIGCWEVAAAAPTTIPNRSVVVGQSITNCHSWATRLRACAMVYSSIIPISPESLGIASLA